MPGTRKALTSAAKKGFTASTGMTCHDAVLEWLEAALYVPANAHTTLFAGEGIQRPTIYGEIFARSSDPQVDLAEKLAFLDEGLIIGFWGEGQLKHSIVATGKGNFSGANNAGVWDSTAAKFPKVGNNLHANFSSSDMLWNAANGTVGPAGYTMHFAAPEIVAERVIAKIGG